MLVDAVFVLSLGGILFILKCRGVIFLYSADNIINLHGLFAITFPVYSMTYKAKIIPMKYKQNKNASKCI